MKQVDHIEAKNAEKEHFFLSEVSPLHQRDQRQKSLKI